MEKCLKKSIPKYCKWSNYSKLSSPITAKKATILRHWNHLLRLHGWLRGAFLCWVNYITESIREEKSIALSLYFMHLAYANLKFIIRVQVQEIIAESDRCIMKKREYFKWQNYATMIKICVADWLKSLHFIKFSSRHSWK